MQINFKKKIYHCWVCDQGGRINKLIADIRGITQQEANKLFSLEEFKEAKNIMIYVSFNNEVDTHDIIKQLLINKEKNVIVPKVKNNSLQISELKDFDDLESRLDNTLIGYDLSDEPVFLKSLNITGALLALLRDALHPNLVQTLEGTPVFVHGGPFANIAHGCNSVIATKTALKMADYVVTEAGFGADLGAEKFFDIKCRKAGLEPSAVVIVATIRALKMNGGVAKDALGNEDVDALVRGCANLGRHIENIQKFGVPAVVAINHFVSDTDAEVQAIKDYARSVGAEAILCQHWEKGSEGTVELANRIVEIAESDESNFTPLYEDDLPLLGKIEKIAKDIYRADKVVIDKKIENQLREWEAAGYGNLPVCMAKTQYSFSTDPNLRGAPTGHAIPVREVRLSAGAGFVVVVCGDIMTMPGLPRKPSAEAIHLDANGEIQGLF